MFVFPLTLAFIDLKYSAAVVCMAATVAAIQEGFTVRGNRIYPFVYALQNGASLDYGVNRFQLREQEQNYAGGEKKW